MARSHAASPTPKRPSRPSRSRPRIEVRASSIQGRGVFTLDDIPKGARIVEYTGERITSAEADARYDDEAASRHHTFLFVVDDDVVIDAARWGSDSRYINHSCSPNCEAIIEDARVYIHATRAISAGDELLYDYAYVTDPAYSDADRRRLYPCSCGASACRGTLAKLQQSRAAKKRKSKNGAPQSGTQRRTKVRTYYKDR